MHPFFHRGIQFEVKQRKGKRGFNWPFLLISIFVVGALALIARVFVVHLQIHSLRGH